MTFVTTYKQADLTLTGTMRKAQLAATATKTSRRHHASSPPPGFLDPWPRRASSISNISQMWQPLDLRRCHDCYIGFSPVWWPIEHDRLLCHKCHWSTVRNANGENGSQSREDKGISNGVEPDSRLAVGV